MMTLYKLLVARKVIMTSHVWVEGDSPEDAQQRFQHQLESESCPDIEDEASWSESYYGQVVKAGPYASEYEVLDVEVEPVISNVITE